MRDRQAKLAKLAMKTWPIDIDPSELKNAVERMHHCSARLIQSVPIREWFEHETVWESAVHIFDLEGHATASRAYAWSSSIEGSDNRRFFAVLHQPPIHRRWTQCGRLS